MPSTVATIGERLLERVEALATELTAVIRRTEPFYGAGGVVPVVDLRSSVRDNLVHILDHLSGRPVPGLEAPRATGRRRAEQGVPLAVILHSYRIAGKFLWAAILSEAPGDTPGLLDAASELWFIIDDLSGAVTDAYRDTVDERARSHEQTRNAMLDVLLRGDPGNGSRLWECAAALRLPQQGTFVVAAAHAGRPGVESIPRAEETLRARGVRSAWRVEVDAHVGVLVVTPNAGIERLSALLIELTSGPVGLSEPYADLARTPAALRQARLACAAASPSGRELVRYEQVPVAVLLASAPDAAMTVARTILGGVLALPETESELLLSTLRVWFGEHGSTSAAAERLHVHRNTVRYRLRRLEDLTGRSLTRPIGVAELHLALEAVRILRV
ncbi:helix-turn-helix domain-containing protein [Streptosporangiaceae bacterium NEAU-GS5]|nr:helix-turn-helix domain-containing protein [Streptosporangiaceae bacterium NEAU-GS5]